VSIKKTLQVVSFNMHAGARADRFSDYLTNAWQHMLPSPGKTSNLAEIADALARFDLVCLQEADGGSTRSGFVHQSQQLALLAKFDTVIDQRNRKVGLKALPFTCSGNSILARAACHVWQDHALPGAVKGRGALAAQIDTPIGALRVINVHLSLTPKAQRAQLNYLQTLIAQDQQPLLLTGDFNCTPEQAVLQDFLHASALTLAPTPPSFPSWAPKRRIDLMLYRGLKLRKCWALPMLASDHLAVAAEFS
jgi:endonuclease/exonuclease/phosphatase family metal-dependent hydrolase